MKSIILSFDVEEFDFLREINQSITDENMFTMSEKGLTKILSLLQKHNLSATFFTTTSFAQYYPDLVQKMSSSHEIASHGLSHATPITLATLTQAKEHLESIIHAEVKGFRAPRWNIKDISLVEKAGFVYDASTHPIFLPGRYNNLNQKRYIHRINKLIEIPLSTLPPNFSIFWLAFKNLPLIYAKIFTRINFLSKDYTMLVFHPWEFVDLTNIPIPFYTKKKSGKELLKMLEEFILFCKNKGYTFRRIDEFLQL